MKGGVWYIFALSVALFVCGSFMLGSVVNAVRLDQRIAWAEKHGQVKVINGIRQTINREGCAEAMGVCSFSSVVRGFGGGECDSFRRTTGKTVKQACCEWWPELNECRVLK